MTLTHHELPQLHTWLPFSQNKLFAIFLRSILLFVSVVSIHPFFLSLAMLLPIQEPCVWSSSIWGKVKDTVSTAEEKQDNFEVVFNCEWNTAEQETLSKKADGALCHPVPLYNKEIPKMLINLAVNKCS